MTHFTLLCLKLCCKYTHSCCLEHLRLRWAAAGMLWKHAPCCWGLGVRRPYTVPPNTRPQITWCTSATWLGLQENQMCPILVVPVLDILHCASRTPAPCFFTSQDRFLRQHPHDLHLDLTRPGHTIRVQRPHTSMSSSISSLCCSGDCSDPRHA